MLSVPSEAKTSSETELPYTYVFVKTFKNEDEIYATYYNAVSVRKDGMEVVVSNYIPDEGRVKREIKGGTLTYIKEVTLPSAADTTVQGDQRTNPVGGSFDAKIAKKAITLLLRAREIGRISRKKKKEIQNIIDALRINPVDYIGNDDLNSAAKIVEEFEKTAIDEGKLVESVHRLRKFAVLAPTKTFAELHTCK